MKSTTENKDCEKWLVGFLREEGTNNWFWYMEE